MINSLHERLLHRISFLRSLSCRCLIVLFRQTYTCKVSSLPLALDETQGGFANLAIVLRQFYHYVYSGTNAIYFWNALPYYNRRVLKASRIAHPFNHIVNTPAINPVHRSIVHHCPFFSTRSLLFSPFLFLSYHARRVFLPSNDYSVIRYFLTDYESAQRYTFFPHFMHLDDN